MNTNVVKRYTQKYYDDINGIISREDKDIVEYRRVLNNKIDWEQII